MEISVEQYNRIMEFLDGNMPFDQMELFEQELEANPSLRKQLDFEQGIRDSFHFKQKHAETFTSVAPAILQPQPSIIGRNWFKLAAAASIVGIIVTVALLRPTKKAVGIDVVNTDTSRSTISDTLQQHVIAEKDDSKLKDLAGLYRKYFTMDALPDEYPMVLADAFSAYEAGNYKKIISIDLSLLPLTRGKDDKEATIRLGRYYKALAFLKTANTKAAIQQLEMLAVSNATEPSGTKVKWYLALAYLQDNNLAKANTLLQELKASSTDKIIHQKAVQLLQQLK